MTSIRWRRSFVMTRIDSLTQDVPPVLYHNKLSSQLDILLQQLFKIILCHCCECNIFHHDSSGFPLMLEVMTFSVKTETGFWGSLGKYICHCCTTLFLSWLNVTLHIHDPVSQWRCDPHFLERKMIIYKQRFLLSSWFIIHGLDSIFFLQLFFFNLLSSLFFF